MSRRPFFMQETTQKIQKPNNLQIPSIQNSNRKIFDLEDRTKEFGIKIITFLKILPKNDVNRRLSDQLLRSATSIGANYIEANDALGKKDFLLRNKVSRKEAKETIYWLYMVLTENPALEDKIMILLKETEELRNILSKIIINAH